MTDTIVTDPQHALTFGAINMIGTDDDIAANGYKIELLSDNTDYGNPVPIEQQIISWLQDGAIVALRGYDNREMKLRVQITGTNGDTLAKGEEALMLETGKPNTLIWTPPDGFGLPSVFSVVMSYLGHEMDDQAELFLERIYTVTIKAEPFVRSNTLATVTRLAPTGTQSITLVDACSSFTGWAATFSVNSAPVRGVTGTVTSGTSGGKVFGQVVNPSDSGGTVQSFLAKLTRTGLSTSLSGTPYLRVVATNTGLIDVGAGPVYFTVNGIDVPVAVQEGTVYWLDTTGLGISTLNTLVVKQAFSTFKPANGTYRLEVDDISRSNFIGTQATNRQLARTLPVAGSARTQGNLAVFDSADALGSVLVHTIPSIPGMMQPNLGVLLATGNTRTGDATTVSGFTSDLSTLHGFDVPVSGLLPGGYLLLARIKHASTLTRTLTWAAKARMGSNSLPTTQAGSMDVALVAGVYQIVTVAKLNLPPRKMGSNGVVRIELTASSTGTVFDEAWLFNVETGCLTKVECGTALPSSGGAANRIWLDAPSVDTPRPGLYLGTNADRTNAYHAADEADSFLVHEFVPPAMNVFTVTTNATAAAITLSHYPRFHTHVAST